MSQPASYYDPHVPKQGENDPGASTDEHQGQTDLNELNKRIQEVTGVLHENVSKLNDRGERLDSLQDKTDNLATSAQGFRRGANRVRKQMWWKDMKMRMCLIAGIVILLLVIIIPAVVATR